MKVISPQNTVYSPFSAKTVRLSAWSPADDRKMEFAFAHPDKVTPQFRMRAIKQFNSMMRAYGNHLMNVAAGRVNFSSEDAFPSLTEQGIPASVIFNTTQRQSIDTRWTMFYRMMDQRSATTPLFRVGDTYTNIDFDEYELGQVIEGGSVEAKHNYYQMKVYGGFYQFNKMWQEWQSMWSPEEGLTAMAMRYARKQASVAYATVTTASGLDTVAYDTGGATAVEKDINTINAGITKIQSDVYAQTSPDGTQTEEDLSGVSFVLLYNNQTAGYQARIGKALEARLDLPNDNQSVGYVISPVVPIGSPDVPTGTWFLSAMGRKNVFANGRDLQIYGDLNAKVAGVNMIEIGQGAYRAVRDDDDQVVILALS